MIKTFKGISKWAKLQKPDKEYDNYSIDVFLTEESLQEFKASGSQLKVRDSDEGSYVSFKRKDKFTDKAGEVQVLGPPTIYKLDPQSGEYVKFSGLIGNGSKVFVTVDIYPTKVGNGTRLERVFVEDLVVYDPQAPDPETAKLPF